MDRPMPQKMPLIFTLLSKLGLLNSVVNQDLERSNVQILQIQIGEQIILPYMDFGLNMIHPNKSLELPIIILYIVGNNMFLVGKKRKKPLNQRFVILLQQPNKQWLKLGKELHQDTLEMIIFLQIMNGQNMGAVL